MSDKDIDEIVAKHWPRTKQTTALRAMVRAATEMAMEHLLEVEEKQEPVASYRLSDPAKAKPGTYRELMVFAERASKNGDHILIHPRDSNNWQNNEAWIKAMSPEILFRLLDELDRLYKKAAQQEQRLTDYSWQTNPDRMGS